MCKTTLQIQCTSFDPEKVKIEKIKCIWNVLYQMPLSDSFHCVCCGIDP